MNARDAILQRIRSELANQPPVQAPAVPDVWPRTNPTAEQLITRFTDELRAVQGEIVRCGSMEDAREKLADLLGQSELNTIQGQRRDKGGRTI